MRRASVFLLLLFSTVALVSNSWGETTFQGHVQPYQPAQTRHLPPAVSYLDTNSQPRFLADYHGQVLVINFWASWCPTCLAEMASLQRLQQQLGDDTKLLTLNQDLDNSSQIQQLLNSLKAGSLPALRDHQGRLGFAMGQTLLPTTILIDSQGRVAGQLIGSADWDSPEAVALIDSLHL